MFIWAALERDKQRIMHVSVTEGCGGIEALGFIKSVLARCGKHPFIYAERGV